MYRSFFGLTERPFDLTPNPRFLVLTDAHREALSNLDYAIASRRGITVLIGEAGTGKTTIIRTALRRQPERVHCIHLHNPALTRQEFVAMLAARFELSDAAGTSKTSLLVELEAKMRARYRDNESTVLIIDEAQSLPLDLLEEIRLLANIETDESKLMSVILAGQPELAERLNEVSLRQLKQRVALRCELRPLTLSETLGYVAGRIAAAGGIGAQLFTREAVMLMHERSRGIPRTISVIADNALVTGYALQRRPVSRAVVEEVCRDLDLTAIASEPPVDEIALPAPQAPGVRDEAASRVLSFESSGPQPSPAGDAITRPASDEIDGGDANRGMFEGISPKRRRFSFFNLTREG